jgi:uncharacterized membrane protein YGL010W
MSGLMGDRTSDQWIAQYASSHQNRWNRACHTLGIPMIAISLFVGAAGFIWPGHYLKHIGLGMFIVGWIFQFIGHAIEQTLPEFFHDPRFLLVGLRWWIAKMRGKA